VEKEKQNDAAIIKNLRSATQKSTTKSNTKNITKNKLHKNLQ